MQFYPEVLLRLFGKALISKPPDNLIPIIISLFAVGLSIINTVASLWIFVYKDRKDIADERRRLELSLFKTLVLDPNLKHYFSFFEKVEAELNKIGEKILTCGQLAHVNDNILDYRDEFKRSFIDLLSGCNRTLYSVILSRTDKFVDAVTEEILSENAENELRAIKGRLLGHAAEAKITIVNSLFTHDNWLSHP